MDDLRNPHHPVRSQHQFDHLQQLERKGPKAWGVKLKLKLGQQDSSTRWQIYAVHWAYGTTALEALDAALAYLVAKSLKE